MTIGDNDIPENEVIFSETNYVLKLYSPFDYTENCVYHPKVIQSFDQIDSEYDVDNQ